MEPIQKLPKSEPTMEQDKLGIAQGLRRTIAVTTSWNDYASAALQSTARGQASDDSLLFATRNVPVHQAGLERVAAYYDINLQQWEPPASIGSQRDAAALIARAETEAAHPGQLVVATCAGACAIIAAYYALATGKQLLIADEGPGVDRLSWPAGCQSVILVGPADLFTKPALRHLLARWRNEPAAFGGVGVLTARTFEQLSTVVCRQLIHRAFTDGGYRSAMPTPGEIPDVRTMRPLEFYVLIGHGSETHIDHGDDDVLCADRTCGHLNEPHWPCLEAAHIPARLLAVHHLFVLSCDLFTPVDGLAPTSNALFHDLLAGWPCSIVAPFKHAQINNGFTILTDSLVRAGYSLGEITAILNGVAPRGAEPDAAYVLLGDPETRIFPEAVNRTSEVDIEADGRGFIIQASARGRRVIDWSVSEQELSLGEGETIGPTPLSDALVAADLLVATMPRPLENKTRFLVMGHRELPEKPLSVRVGPVTALAEADRVDLVERIGRLGFLENLGVDPRMVSDLRRRLLAPLRNAGSYPRGIDFMLGAAAAHCVLPLLRDDLAEVRRIVLTELCAGIARERSWFSHRYRAVYPSQRRLPANGAEPTCPACRGGLTRWRSDDPTGEAETRTLEICERCGIVADRPASHPLTVTFEVGAGIRGSIHRQQFHVTNESDRPVAASLAAQFNQWEALGIRAEPRIVELDLEPAASALVDIDYVFAKTHPIDLISLHCYVMSERCEVAAFTRRLVLEPHSTLVEA